MRRFDVYIVPGSAFEMRVVLLDESLPDVEYDLDDGKAVEHYGEWRRAARRALPNLDVELVFPSRALQLWAPPMTWEQLADGVDTRRARRDDPYCGEPRNDDPARAFQLLAGYEDGAYTALSRVLRIDLGVPQSEQFTRRWVRVWRRERLPDYCELRDYLAFEAGVGYIVACSVAFRHFEQLARRRVLARQLAYLRDAVDDDE